MRDVLLIFYYTKLEILVYEYMPFLFINEFTNYF